MNLGNEARGATNHWSFERVRKPEIPRLRRVGNSEPNPIDAFIFSKLEREGMQSVGVADPASLLRRVTFDLIGLPPTPEELRSFLKKPTRAAYSNVVERLLASPRYGERWGRHWMDVVRYADTAGDNADYPIPEIRLYRD